MVLFSRLGMHQLDQGCPIGFKLGRVLHIFIYRFIVYCFLVLKGGADREATTAPATISLYIAGKNMKLKPRWTSTIATILRWSFATGMGHGKLKPYFLVRWYILHQSAKRDRKPSIHLWQFVAHSILNEIWWYKTHSKYIFKALLTKGGSVDSAQSIPLNTKGEVESLNLLIKYFWTQEEGTLRDGVIFENSYSSLKS